MRLWQGGVLSALLVWSCSTVPPSSQSLFRYYLQTPPSRLVSARFSDEFSELDDPDSASRATTTDTVVSTFVEHARAYYLQALERLESGDTARAAIAFERSLSILHTLASSPAAQRSQEFSELVQSVLEDYETHIRNPELLDPNSAFFLVREQLLDAVDRAEAERRIATAQPPYPSYPTAGEPNIPKTTIPLPRNEYVERALDFLSKDRGRRFMQRWLERSGRYFPMMRRMVAEEGLPEEIIYLSMIESGLNPFAVSWAGAVGLWQFIYSTGRLYGLRVTPWIDERRDPEKATRAALRHLRDLYTEFGDWHLALAAYNCGAQAVRRALAQARRALAEESTAAPPQRLTFWDIREYLPRETRNYVPLYIATTLIALNPRLYGFNPDELTYEPEYVYDVYELSEPMNLQAVARCLDISVDSLRQLNPELLSHSTPPDVPAYPLKIPLGRREAFQQCLSALSPSEKQPWIVHIVRRGETLAGIAARYGVPMSELQRLNRLGRRLRAGMRLHIPVVTTATNLNATGSDSARALPPPPTADIPGPTSPPASTATSPPQRRVMYHLVRRGETLARIAQRYGVSIAELKSWNRLRVDRLKAGQRLRIYRTSDAPLTYILHRVRRNETAHNIAQRYGVTVTQLQEWNPSCFRKGILLAGSTLRIYVQRPINGKTPSSRQQNRIYTVRAGDSLFSIARRFGVSVEELRNYNDLEGDYIRVGQRLRIP
ncbi:MAG: LysM peptidoglycan-binding domain-containing protein [Bacteroidota bacterium]|nr:LysM peptidoglycan-binding domain-containing protein [Bacteroidota bacterium]